MKNALYRLAATVLLGGLITSAAWAGLAGSSTVPVELSADDAKAILIGKQRFWADGAAIQIACLSDDAVAAQIEALTGMNATRFKSHWTRLVFTGKGVQPRFFDSLEELKAFVEANANVLAITPGDPEGFPVTVTMGQ